MFWFSLFTLTLIYCNTKWFFFYTSGVPINVATTVSLIKEWTTLSWTIWLVRGGSCFYRPNTFSHSKVRCIPCDNIYIWYKNSQNILSGSDGPIRKKLCSIFLKVHSLFAQSVPTIKFLLPHPSTVYQIIERNSYIF